MLSRAFLLHAFSIVPFTRWPVLIWHIIMVQGWIAELLEAGEPVPGLFVSRDGIIYRAEYEGPGVDHWRNRLHDRDPDRCAALVRDHMAAHHGRERAALALALTGEASLTPCPCARLGDSHAACAPGQPALQAHLAPEAHMAHAARAELPLPQT